MAPLVPLKFQYSIFMYPLWFSLTYLQGGIKEWEKSNHLVWLKTRVKLLFLEHHLWGNMTPFTLITLNNPWCHLFWSKLSMQKMLRNAQNCHIWPILANLTLTNCLLWAFLKPKSPQNVTGKPNECDSHYLRSMGSFLVNKIELNVQNCLKFSFFATNCNDLLLSDILFTRYAPIDPK